MNDVHPRRMQQIVTLHTRVFVKRVLKHLSDDLRLPPWRGQENPLAGHCYVASEALYHLTGGPVGPWKPMHIRHAGVGHWYLQHRETGEVLDVTAAQFEDPIDYAQGRGRGFMTSKPSARTRTLLLRIKRS